MNEIIIGAKALIKQLDDEMSRTARQITEAVRLLAGDFSEAEMDTIRAYINELVAAHNRANERHARAVRDLQNARDELALAR
jgi:outer membrane murein-binding lipoprotein Lpp